MNNAKVSVCIAVYNVEKYIEQCVRSLFEQTLDDLEYVFVDDASPDASIDVMLRVLEEYPHRKNQVKLIRHEHNQGVAVTRKDAIAAATGEYIIHCDPDDWVELDMYEKLYEKAVESNADMVYCGFLVERDGSSEIQMEDAREEEDLLEAFFLDKIRCSLWNKLYKSSIVQSEKVKWDRSLKTAEDWVAVTTYFQLVKKFSRVDFYLYHYRVTNPDSLTKNEDLTVLLLALDLAKGVVTDKKYGKYLKLAETRLLLRSIAYDALPVAMWYSRSKNVKNYFWKIKYPWGMKSLFYLACINYPFAVWLWRKIRERKK